MLTPIPSLTQRLQALILLTKEERVYLEKRARDRCRIEKHKLPALQRHQGLLCSPCLEHSRRYTLLLLNWLASCGF